MDIRLNENMLLSITESVDYLEDNSISSYLLLAINTNRADFILSSDYEGSANDLIAHLELFLTELKMRVVTDQLIANSNSSDGSIV